MKALINLLFHVVIFGVSLPINISHSFELDLAEQWCNGKGKPEVTLLDRTRVDCLTDTHAIEVEYAHKWKQAIGQSLHYALMTDKQAGIVLILRKEADYRYLESLTRVADRYNLPINVWTLNQY